MPPCACRYGEPCDNVPKPEDVVIPVEKLEDFWREIYPHGMTLDRVNAELSDIHMLIDHCTAVYTHFSDGMISKPNTYPEQVIALSDEREQKEYEENLDEVLESIAADYDIPIAELKMYL